MLKAAVLSATAVAGMACGATPAAPTSQPTFENSQSTEAAPDDGPEDLRVVLPNTVLGGAAASSESMGGITGHGGASLRRALETHGPELASCLTDVELRGAQSFTLSLEIDSTGTVLGGSTSPGPGRDGISRVAGCVLSQARGWLFPARNRRGRTILIIPLVVPGE